MGTDERVGVVTTSKPGKYGTLHLYRIVYRDAGDMGCPDFSMRVWAYTAEHAEDKFNDSDDTGWTVLRVERVRA